MKNSLINRLAMPALALGAMACEPPITGTEDGTRKYPSLSSAVGETMNELVVETPVENVEGLPLNPSYNDFVPIGNHGYAFTIESEVAGRGNPGPIRAYRQLEDGTFVPEIILGADDLRFPTAEGVSIIPRSNVDSARMLHFAAGLVTELNIQVSENGGLEITNPQEVNLINDPDDQLGNPIPTSTIKSVTTSDGQQVALLLGGRDNRTVWLINGHDDPQLLGRCPDDVVKLPDIHGNRVVFGVPAGQVQDGRQEARISEVPAGLNPLEAMEFAVQLNNSEPISLGRIGNNLIVQDIEFGPNGANELMFLSVGGGFQKLSLEDPIIPPVDAAVQDAAPQDSGVDAASEQDAATPDAEVSPADSGSDAEVSQPDAEPADMSISPDMAESDAEPDGGMVEEDSAVPDQGVDMEVDQGTDSPAVCGDNICDITETVNNCLADCFEAFSVAAGDCRIEVSLVEEGVVELQGTGETADTCIAEFKVPGFDTPVRYIVNSEAERGRLEFEGVIFLDENEEPMLGTVWGRNVHTIVNLEEDGQKWLLGDLKGLSLAGVATKILLQKISEDEDGNQLWKAVNGNTIVEGGVYAFDPKGNVVAIIPPAATFHFEVNEEEERVEIQAVETGDPEPGLRIVGGSACSDAEQDGCETIPTKGNAPISLLLLAAARVGMKRRKR